MGKAAKSTKKFLKKSRNPMKKANMFGKKFHGRKREDAKAAAEEPASDDDNQQKKIEDMDIDEFLAGDFLNKQQKGGSDDDEHFSDAEEDFSDLGSDGDDDDEAFDVQSVEEDDASSSSDDDDDLDDATKEVKNRNKKLKSEIESHKDQLEKLKEQDPEFYAYLQSTDKELLNFGQDDDESDSEEDDNEEAAAGSDDDEDQPTTKDKATVTLATVDAWCKAAKDKASHGAVRNLIRAYRVACHFGDTEEQLDETMKIGSSAVYNKLMLFVLKEADGIFKRMLNVDKDAVLKANELNKIQKWRKVEPLIKSYMGNTLNLLGQMTDPTMLAFILRRVRASVVYLAPYDKLQRRYLKQALQLFGSAEAGPRVQSILMVRQMALVLPQPSLDNCLKGVYRAFSINSKFVNASSMPHINFMAASVVELYGIDPAVSYQHAFQFIRQLALLVRSALTSKTKESFREVYCWQTINCLELWAKVLAAHSDNPDLRQLIYPVAQLLLGAARLVPTPSYFPLRLRCALALNRLGQATGVFMPVAPVLLEVFQWSDLSKSPRPGRTVEPLLQLRVGKTILRTSSYQEEIVLSSLEMLADHLAQWSCHVGFPELAHLPLVRLRKFCKVTPIERFRKAAKQLVDAIERNVVFVGKARDNVEFSPKDINQVGSFLASEAAGKRAPLQQYSAVLQEKARQRINMRMAQDVLIDEKGGRIATNRGSESSDEEDYGSDEDIEAPTGNMLASARKNAAAKRQAAQAAAEEEDDSGSEEEDDEEEEGSGDDDVVQEYQLSDDDDDQDVMEFDNDDESDDDDEGMFTQGGSDSDEDQRPARPSFSGSRGGGRGRSNSSSRGGRGDGRGRGRGRGSGGRGRGGGRGRR